VNRPARVLFVTPSLKGGGAERVLVTLLGHLDPARFEPVLATFFEGNDYPSCCRRACGTSTSGAPAGWRSRASAAGWPGPSARSGRTWLFPS